jgi:chromosome segregation ATPase
VSDTDSEAVETDESTEPGGGTPRRLDVRAVLDEMGAEDTLAHLEGRVESLERDLERSESRAREGDRARRGELDLMRARIDEALELVRDTMQEQRGAFGDFEERFGALVTGVEEASRSFVDELRDDLTPRVQKAVHGVEEARADLRGEIAAVAGDAEGRTAAQSEALAAARAELDAAIEELRAGVAAEAEQRGAALSALEQRLASRLEELTEETSRRLDAQHDRTEALRRELDAAAGELRAGMRLEANELRDALAELHTELGQAIDDQAEGAAELERRWIDGTRDIARRLEELQRETQERIQAERGARHEAVDTLTSRVEELGGTLDELHGRVGSDGARRGTELETVRREQDELGNRLDVLQSKVAQAVGRIASELSNRVATVAGDLEALRESGARHQERLAAVEHVERRLGELATAQDQLAASVASGPSTDEDRVARLEAGLAELRQQVADLTGSVGESRQQTRDVAAGISGLNQSLRSQEGLRQEVRELAARSSELSHRLDETERLARAAGQAIASAVRRARSGAGPAPASERPPASERASIFGDRPPTVRRDEEGRPIAGLDHLRPQVPPDAESVSADDLRALEDIDAAGGDD